MNKFGLCIAITFVACHGGTKTEASKAAEGKPAPAAPAPVAPAPAAPAPVATPVALFETPEAIFDGTKELPLADGKVRVGAIRIGGEHGPVALRAAVDGKRVELAKVTTGDCSGGTVVELTAAADGSVVARLGQLAYSSCDDDTEGVAAADIDSHLECVRLTWDASAVKVNVESSARVASADKLPAWCQDAATP